MWPLMVDDTSAHTTALHRGDPVPHFRVATIENKAVEYATIWQRRNLVLVALSKADTGSATAYVSQFEAEAPAFHSHDTECVLTRDIVPGITPPAVLIADRWGEIVHIASGSDVVDLPSVGDVLDWLAYLQTRCPECEGETK